MAESDSDNTGTWVLLRDYLLLKLAEVHHPALAERLVRIDLSDRRRRHRYLDANGALHQDALSGKFWMEAKIDIVTSSAFQTARLFPRCQHGRGVGFAAIDMDGVYRIEVLVPHQHPQPITSEPLNLMPTGMPGKPNLSDIVVAEAKRRLAAGEVDPRSTLIQFAEILQAWWEEKRQTYTPVQRSLTVKTIENAVRHLPCWRNRKA